MLPPYPLLPLMFAVAVIALTAAVVWLTRQLHRAQEDAATLRQHLSTAASDLEHARHELHSLSGLLPMCAWCKKIRDDAGYWQQLEGYIQSHTHVEFSHSLCPDCTDKVQADMPDAHWRI